MENLKIKKSIDIPASREQVWEVLINDELTPLWYAYFSEGAHAVTDWEEGSKAIFKDNSDGGMIGRIAVSRPSEELVIVFEGILNAGQEDYESEAAQQVKGGREIYRLTEKDGHTRLSIESDMTPDYFESMSEAWEKALQKISELAVRQEQNIPSN